MKEAKYFGWEDLETIRAAFEPTADEYFPVEDEVLFASLAEDGYEEEAYILFEHDGKLWEVVGSHCSCYGFEGQWKPGETSWGALQLAVNERVKSELPDGRIIWGCILNGHPDEAYAHLTGLVYARMQPTPKP